MDSSARLMSCVVIATFMINAAGDSDGRTRASGRTLHQSPPSIGDGWHSLYRDYDQICERMAALATHYSELVSLRTMKRMTVQNREIAYMRFGGYTENSRRVVIVGLQHAREWLAASMTMYITERLLSGYQSNDEELQLFLDNFELIVIPVLNPDGLQYTFSDRYSYLGAAVEPCTYQEQSQGSCNRMWRKNRQFVADGQGCTGIDLNRAWPVDWGMRGGEAVSVRPCAEDYAGEHPFQAEEALALCELLADLHGTSEQQLCYNVTSSRAEGGWSSTSGLPSKGIVGLLDFHAYGQLILGSWAHLNLHTNNKAVITSIGMAMLEAANEGCKSSECMWSYGIGDLEGEIYLTSGTLPDWSHWAFGAASFTVELPPRTQAQGGFDPYENLVQCYTEKSFPIVTAYLSGLQQDRPTVPETGTAVLACHGKTSDEKMDLEVANMLDHYPRELSWEVVDASSRDRLAGWDANYGGVRPGEDFAVGGQMMLCHGVYIVVIRDSNGDGSCCKHGQGATSVISKGKVLFKGDGAYGTGQVLLVRLSSVPLALAVDPSLYPMSQELLETISAMRNEENPDGFWSSLDAIRSTKPSSGLSPLETGLVAAGSAAAAAVLLVCTRILVRHVFLRRQHSFRQSRAQSPLRRVSTQESRKSAKFSGTLSSSESLDHATPCPIPTKTIRQGSGVIEILSLPGSSPSSSSMGSGSGPDIPLMGVSTAREGLGPYPVSGIQGMDILTPDSPSQAALVNLPDVPISPQTGLPYTTGYGMMRNGSRDGIVSSASSSAASLSRMITGASVSNVEMRMSPSNSRISRLSKDTTGVASSVPNAEMHMSPSNNSSRISRLSKDGASR